MGEVERHLLGWRLVEPMFSAKDAVVRPEHINDKLDISAPISAVVEDQHGGELDPRKIFALHRENRETL
jgi:hypothetical protein